MQDQRLLAPSRCPL